MIQDSLLREIAKNNGLEFAALRAFIQVETGGIGFAKDTGKLIIQFEPVWFKRKAPYAPSGAWTLNKVDRQSQEWIAFNDAFKKYPDAAMESCSIGIGQIMGFHFKTLGYATVGEMWDDAKRGEYQQVLQMVRFIKSFPALYNALKEKNWHLVATYYNGSGYKQLAVKYGREPYDLSMAKAYQKYQSA